MTLKISPIEAFTDNYIWILKHPKHESVAVVDPGDADPVLAYLNANRLSLQSILITHHHLDHTGGIETLLSTHNTQKTISVYGPHYETTHRLAKLISHPLTEGDVIHLEHLETAFQILSIPGHTLDHIAYYGDEKLFCGDTLFSAGCGRLFEGTAEQMFSALDKIKALPNTTEIFPAHEYTKANLEFATTIAPENQAIQTYLSQVQALRAQDQPSLPTTLEQELQINLFLKSKTIEQFKQIRKLKDDF